MSESSFPVPLLEADHAMELWLRLNDQGGRVDEDGRIFNVRSPEEDTLYELLTAAFTWQFQFVKIRGENGNKAPDDNVVDAGDDDDDDDASDDSHKLDQIAELLLDQGERLAAVTERQSAIEAKLGKDDE